ncbi:MAG: hypothetical protein NTW03_05000, partial [Verrucomicrobia bacterium]|nr:hypothetical protein [Verrucomicrobiota bacterium]
MAIDKRWFRKRLQKQSAFLAYLGTLKRMYDRWYGNELRANLTRPFVHLIFGARQTGKTTLLNAMLPTETVRVDFANPVERSRHLANPGL